MSNAKKFDLGESLNIKSSDLESDLDRNAYMKPSTEEPVNMKSPSSVSKKSDLSKEDDERNLSIPKLDTKLTGIEHNLGNPSEFIKYKRKEG